MKVINWIIFVCLVAVVLTLVQVVRQWLRRKRDYALLSERVHLQTDCYAFLIDRNLRVKETNFYELNEDIQDNQPYVLGNVLHCQTAIDEGLCGTGIDCDTCPIRMVIKNAFKLKRDFDHVEASMRLFDEHHETKEMDVRLDGELVYVGKEPHLIVTARKIGSSAAE